MITLHRLPMMRLSTAAVLAALVALASSGVLATAAPARADSAPSPASPANPATVTADGLPTAQINGVVWSQVVVGNTVYAGGSFTSARPAGSPAGTNEVPRGNLLSFDITTGALVPSFAPALNGQVRAVTASPDGSRVYVGGDFTQADGQTRSRVAAYDTATGKLVSTFHPAVTGTVRAIAVTGATVYVGGSFGSVGSVSRTKLAAFSAADGSLLPWAPVPGPGPTDRNSDPSKTPAQNAALNYDVLALVTTGGGSQVVAAGRFDTMNGVKATAVAALDPATGATRPFAVNGLITNQGVNSAVFSLSTSTDGGTVIGTGYDFYGPGNLEGAFEVAADGGAVIAIDDCHGDTYSSFDSGSVLYLSSHAHDCSNIGGFPEENPRINKYATAFTTAAVGTVGPATEENANLQGLPAVAPLDWFPTLTMGTYTNQGQAGWSVTGNSRYVVYGGEFPAVNGVAQQGLVRFAVPGAAPGKIGPSGGKTLVPTLVGISGGVRVSWQSAWDQDNQTLSYAVIRSDRPSTPVYQTTAPSTFWQRPALGFVDRSVQAGQSYTYRVRVTDPSGNTVTSAAATTTAPAAANGSADRYGTTVLADSPSHYWRFDEPAGSTTTYDQAAFDDLALSAGVGQGAAGALGGNPDTAATFDGAQDGLAATASPVPGPQVFSLEAWFDTTSTAGGKIVGFGNANTGTSSSYDRHVYMDGSGTVYFGVYPGFLATVQSSHAYNDGTWHHVVATLGPAGMALYLDGQLVGQRSDVTSAQDYSGYWRVGGDSAWSGSNWFAGAVDEVAVYPTVLTADQAAAHHEVGTTGQPYDHPPVASFTSSGTGLTAAFDGRGSTDPDGAVTGWAWDFGDGTTGTGATASHTYGTPGAYRATLTVTDGTKQATTAHVLSVTATGSAASAYASAVAADGASAYWRLDEPSGRGFDRIGTDDLTVGSGVTRGTPGALAGDQDGAATFDGTPDGLAVGQTQVQGPDTFSVEAWFRTTSTSGGKIVGFGDQPSGWSGNYDRHVYMDGSGTVYFGVWTGSATTVQSAPGFADGRWHHVVASLGSDGLAMYLDGTLVGRNTSTSSGQSYRGYWRIGGDNTWAGAPFFAGSVDEVAIYPTVLTADQVAAHHRLGTATAPANQPPAASFTSSSAGLTATVDGSGSSDPDGSVSSYAWTFGDGGNASGSTASHGYAAAGTYPVTLTVTDDGGLTATTTSSVTVTAPNQPPKASFASSSAGLTATVDGSGSADPDGSVRTYAWTFGDGGTASGVTASHTYAAAGSYPVTLTVTDDGGLTATTTSSVTVTAPNRPPSASFTSTPSGLTVGVDGSASTDADGSVKGYAWTFGDGGTGSGITATHTYAAAGSYRVTLVVTDDAGASGTASSSVTVTAPPAANQPPAASFSSSPSGLSVGVDGSRSSDPDGSVTGWAWTFGDGGTATGVTASHTYATAGSYRVTLTVTDDGGATTTTSSTVTVTAPPLAIAADSFRRTATGGWGTADTGGAWTSLYGAARLAVSGGSATMSLSAIANLDEAALSGVSSAGTNTLASLAVTGTQSGNGTSVYVIGRRAGTNLEYRARLRFLPSGAVAVGVTRLSGTASEALVGAEVVVPGLAYTSGEPLQVRFVVSGTGTTQLAATVWRAGTAEPSTPTVTRTDTTAALQVSGGVGLAAYLAGNGTPPVTVRFTGYQVTAAG